MADDHSGGDSMCSGGGDGDSRAGEKAQKVQVVVAVVIEKVVLRMLVWGQC